MKHCFDLGENAYDSNCLAHTDSLDALDRRHEASSGLPRDITPDEIEKAEEDETERDT